MPELGRVGCQAWLALVVCAAGSAAGAEAEPVWAPDVFGGYASTHVIIKVAPGARPVFLADGRLTVEAKVAQEAAGPETLVETFERWRVTAVTPLFENGFANPQRARQLGLDRYFRAEVPRGSDTPALVADLGRHRTVIERAEVDPVGGVADTIPDDADFDLLWGMLNTGQIIAGTPGTPGADINITPAWDITTGDSDLVLAVLDAGLDEHVDILDRVVPGRNVAAERDNDDTSDSCQSHGTHVSGTAGAATNNKVGVAGADWSCRIMPVRVLNSCSGLESYVAEGLIWAADNGADVINMSLQYFIGTEALEKAVNYAHGEGVVMIAASGNQGAGELAFPARYEQTIAVGAFNNLGNRWSNSNGGPNLDVMGPGVRVWSLKDTDEYVFKTGTSMATPHVSGTVALMKSLDPSLTPDEIQQIVRDTAVDMGSAGFDEGTGWGRLDAYAAILSVDVIPGDLDGDGVVGIGDLLILLQSWGPCPDPCPPSCSADLDGDCTVGMGDLLFLFANWG